MSNDAKQGAPKGEDIVLSLWKHKAVVKRISSNDTYGKQMVGLADEMIKVHYDEHGEMLPAYGFFNNDDYKKVQPKDAICILYSMKANGPLNSEIHGTTYARINGGMIQFLIKEQDAKIALLATKVGQKMSIEQRVKRLMPHEMTSSLFEEMAKRDWPFIL